MIVKRFSLVILPLAILGASAFGSTETGQPGQADPTSGTNTAVPVPAQAEVPTPAPAPASAPAANETVAVASVATPKFDMTEAAARYVALVKEADRISTLNPLSVDAIMSSLRLTSRMSSRGITEGAGAYIALTAASQSDFASSFATVVNLLGKEAVMVRLKDNPQALFSMINGYGSASKLASGALSTSLATLTKAEETLGAAAYSVQRETWSQSVVNTDATLAMIRSEAAAPTNLEELTVWTLPPRISDDAINPRFMLAASYRLLGDDVAATQLLDKPAGRTCMNRVQLNVRQCIAASQYPYEHLFCLSKHSFGETNGCVKDALK